MGSKKHRECGSIKPKVVPGKLRCLVCGVGLDKVAGVSSCNRRCDFSCHSRCLAALYKAQRYHEHQHIINPIDWSCNDVTLWIDLPTVSKINSWTIHEKIIYDTLLSQGYITSTKKHPDSRKRRYDNEDIDSTCPVCLEVVHIEQKDHLWSYCSGIPGTPPSSDPMEPISRVKRRCLEISNINLRERQLSLRSAQNVGHHQNSNI